MEDPCDAQITFKDIEQTIDGFDLRATIAKQRVTIEGSKIKIEALQSLHNELERKLKIAVEALQWANEMFEARDIMKANIRFVPVKFSPITERVKQALKEIGEP